MGQHLLLQKDYFLCWGDSRHGYLLQCVRWDLSPVHWYTRTKAIVDEMSLIDVANDFFNLHSARLNIFGKFTNKDLKDFNSTKLYMFFSWNFVCIRLWSKSDFSFFPKSGKFCLFHIVEKVKYVAVTECLVMFKIENCIRRLTMIDNNFSATFDPFILTFKGHAKVVLLVPYNAIS